MKTKEFFLNLSIGVMTVVLGFALVKLYEKHVEKKEIAAVPDSGR